MCEAGLDLQCGRVFALLLPSADVILTLIIVFLDMYVTNELTFSYIHILISSLPTSHGLCLHLLLKRGQVWNQTCVLSKTFLSEGTTIRAAPPPPCPCVALKGSPSWRLSWWWGLSVYYWAFCSPNSLPRVASPSWTRSLARRHCFMENKRPGCTDWMHICL